MRKPLKATDRRRPGLSDNSRNTVQSHHAVGHPLADLFKDRRHANGSAKRAVSK